MRYVPPERRFLQEPHGVTSQNTTFFIVTAVKTSNFSNKMIVDVDRLSSYSEPLAISGHEEGQR
jgi:hypothetical protein